MSTPTSDPIHVALGSLPGLMADLIRSAILIQSDMVIVGEAGDGDDLDALDQVDVVVTSSSSLKLPSAHQRLLFGERHVDVVAISADGRRMETYHHRLVQDFSSEQLIGAIRELTRPRGVA